MLNCRHLLGVLNVVRAENTLNPKPIAGSRENPDLNRKPCTHSALSGARYARAVEFYLPESIMIRVS